MSNTTEAAVIFEHFLAQLERANTLEKRVWILEKENTALKQEAGYCVDEGCDHANTIHVCSTASVTKDVINNALIGSSIISKADTQLQADIEALAKRVADLEFASSPGYYNFDRLTDGQKTRAIAFNQAVEQQIMNSVRPGGALYGLVK